MDEQNQEEQLEMENSPPSEEEDSQDVYHPVSESEEESEHCQEELSNLQVICSCCPTRNSWYEPSYGPVLEQDHGVDTNIFLPEFDKYSIKTHTKSHFYQSLGFCLYQREDIIVWTDLDLEYIQKNNYISSHRAGRVYYGGSIKYNSHSYMVADSDEVLTFSLSPTFQARRVHYPLSQEAVQDLASLGLRAEIIMNEEFNHSLPFLVIKMRYYEVIKEDIKENLIAFLKLTPTESGQES